LGFTPTPKPPPHGGGEQRDCACVSDNMIGRLNHVAIAVPDLEAAMAKYRDGLGAKVSKPQVLPEHGVTVVFVELDNAKVELLHPLGEDSPIAGFLEKNPSGGMHHMCFEVSDIRAAAEKLSQSGARVLGDGEPKIGAHGLPVLFLHPKDFDGTLIELEEIAR
jgi:methylmalonyl-CoA/ethylmalonyl-CoA epimerase